MSKKFQKIPKSVKGMRDILPDEVSLWQDLEKKLRWWFNLYDFSEIRTPLVEEAELFCGAIGEGTDIVTKEMYSFTDKGERSLSLRPEATASIARAYIEHSFHKTDPVAKWYYIGPMFRAERPQKGRQRQFHQAGVELIGLDTPFADAETIALLYNLFTDEKYGFGFSSSDITLKINNIGCDKDRINITENLRNLLSKDSNSLCEDCRQRIDTNVLRVLDCKNPSCRKIIDKIPDLNEWVCGECTEHFGVVRQLLDSLGVKYQITPHLVRGLDYYSKTVFELTSSKLGGQDALAAGGRYDSLLDRFGVSGIGAVGFAIGLERVLITLGDNMQAGEAVATECFVAVASDDLRGKAYSSMNKLRKAGISVAMDLSGKSLKAQFRQADKSGARFVIVFGEEEFKKGNVVIKDMTSKEQEELSLQDVTDYLKERK